MFQKTFTYRDLHDQEVNETWCFQLSEADMIEIEMVSGGLAQWMQESLKKNDRSGIVEMLKTLLRKAVGKKSDDGSRFIKTPALAEEFMNGECFSEMFVYMIQNPDNMPDLIRSIAPSKFVSKIDEHVTAEKARTVDPYGKLEAVLLEGQEANDLDDLLAQYEGKDNRKPEEYTEKELLTMSKEHFFELFGQNPKKWNKQVLQLAVRRRQFGLQ